MMMLMTAVIAAVRGTVTALVVVTQLRLLTRPPRTPQSSRARSLPPVKVVLLLLLLLVLKRLAVTPMHCVRGKRQQAVTAQEGAVCYTLACLPARLPACLCALCSHPVIPLTSPLNPNLNTHCVSTSPKPQPQHTLCLLQVPPAAAGRQCSGARRCQELGWWCTRCHCSCQCGQGSG